MSRKWLQYAHFWVWPSLFFLFLLVNTMILLLSINQYFNAQYHKAINAFSDVVIAFIYDRESLANNIFDKSLSYSLSEKASYTNKVSLKASDVKGQPSYFWHNYFQSMLEKQLFPRYQSQTLSVCFSERKICLNLTLKLSELAYLFMLLLIFSLSTLLILPMYFFLNQKLITPFYTMQEISHKLGLVQNNQCAPTKFSFVALAELMMKVSQKLNQVADEKLRLFSALSHDLKTPLMKYKLYYENKIDKKHHNALEKYYNDIGYLLNQILIYAQKDYYHEVFEDVDMGDFIESECYEYQTHGFAVFFMQSTDEVIVANIQRRAFKRVLQNLIGNGIKYGRSKVSVSLHAKRNSIVINIVDDGDGVDEVSLEKIFEPFYRAQNHRGKAGSGLGLAIVKEILDKHNASILLQNGEREFVVCIELPRL